MQSIIVRLTQKSGPIEPEIDLAEDAGVVQRGFRLLGLNIRHNGESDCNLFKRPLKISYIHMNVHLRYGSTIEFNARDLLLSDERNCSHRFICSVDSLCNLSNF